MVEDSCADLEFWSARRYSAKDFTGGAISFKQYAGALLAAASPPPVHIGDAARLIPFVIRLRVPGACPGCERLDRIGSDSARVFEGETIAKRLWEACQRQNIVKSAAFAVVIAANQADSPPAVPPFIVIRF